MKPGNLVRNKLFLDLHVGNPRSVGENWKYDPSNVPFGSVGVILEIDPNTIQNFLTWRVSGCTWVKWYVNGMTGWSDPTHMDIIG